MSSLPTMFAGIIIIVPDLVRCLFGANWMAVVHILQILARYAVLRVLIDFGHPLLLAKAGPDLYLSKAIAFRWVYPWFVFGAIFLVIVGSVSKWGFAFS